MVRLKKDGVPILGFTWYSLLDQTDWDTALREVEHRINPMGLYDLNRKIRKVGKAYKALIAQWQEQLPIESMSRDMYLTRQDVQATPKLKSTDEGKEGRGTATSRNPASDPTHEEWFSIRWCDRARRIRERS